MKIAIALALLLAVLSAATLWRAAAREAATEAAHPPAGQFIDVDGTSVHYLEAGTGPAIVLIHGASGHLGDWSFDMVDRLSDRYRVIAFDRPGLGYTETIGDSATAEAQARLLAAAAAQLGVERPLVVGHSYGGAVALAWGVHLPDATSGLLILAGASNPWSTGNPPFYTALSHRIIGPIMAALIAAWVSDDYVEGAVAAAFDPQSPPEGYGEHFAVGLSLRRATLVENARQRSHLLPQIQAMVPQYPDIDVPTEILHGDADITVPVSVHSEPLSRQIPDANLVVMPGVGHMPHHVEPETVAQAIDRLATRAQLR